MECSRCHSLRVHFSRKFLRKGKKRKEYFCLDCRNYFIPHKRTQTKTIKPKVEPLEENLEFLANKLNLDYNKLYKLLK